MESTLDDVLKDESEDTLEDTSGVSVSIVVAGEEA